MRKKLRRSKITGQAIERTGEQLLETLLALADHQGNPNKGQRAYMTKALKTRYKLCSLPITTNELPHGRTLTCSILKGMFLINTTPLGTHKVLKEYVNFLMQRYILTQFRKGSDEVHLIFDNPGQLKNTPKSFEQARRDATAIVIEGHQCTEFNQDTKLKGKWRETVINCIQCKRQFAKLFSQYVLHSIGTYLSPKQTCIVAGVFEGDIAATAWFVQG